MEPNKDNISQVFGPLKALIFSFVLSAISLLVVLVAPLNISEPIPSLESPYENELELLRSKKFLLPEDNQRFRELVQIHNEFVLSQAILNPKGAPSAWSKKSTILSPIIALIWIILFLVATKRALVISGLTVMSVVSFPVVLLVMGAMSIVEMSVICSSIFAIVVWRQVYGVRSNKKIQPTQ